MLAQLAVPFADARAADLSWSLGLPPVDALADLTVTRAGVRLDLRILGGSHQVLLETPDVACSEVVACLADPGHGLPGRVEQALPGLTYAFSSRTDRLTTPQLAELVARLRRECGDDSSALLAHFPGHDCAVTAIRATAGEHGVGWRTWHVYPQTGEAVVTRTRVELP